MCTRIHHLLLEAERMLDEPGAFTDRPPPRSPRPRKSSTGGRCPNCKRELEPSDFHKGQDVCRDCNYARVKAWRKANPVKWHEQDRRRKVNKRRRARDARDRVALEANADKADLLIALRAMKIE